MALRHGWDGEPDRAFLVEDGGLPVGTASLGASEWDNLDLAWLDLAVHPDHRRRGLGSRALHALHEECLRIGRPLVGLESWDAPAPRGFAAETTAAGVLYTTAFVYAVPVSTTHTITSAIMGAGATKRLSAVRWGVARTIVTAWVLTIPAAALVAAVFYELSRLVEAAYEED